MHSYKAKACGQGRLSLYLPGLWMVVVSLYILEHLISSLLVLNIHAKLSSKNTTIYVWENDQEGTFLKAKKFTE